MSFIRFLDWLRAFPPSRRGRLYGSPKKFSHRSKLALGVEVLEDRRLFSCNRIALLVNGLGGGDANGAFLSSDITNKLVELGFRGIGAGKNDLMANWNSLKQERDPGSVGPKDTPQIQKTPLTTRVTVPVLNKTINIPTPNPLGIPVAAVVEVDIGSGTVTDFVNAAAPLLDAFSDEDIIVLIGHSLGGEAVLRLATAVQVEIDLLATLDPVGFVPVPPGTDTIAEAEAATGQNFQLPDRVQVTIPGPSVPGVFTTPNLAHAEFAIPVTVDTADGLRNREGEMPGFRVGVNGQGGLTPLPNQNNVKYFYNRWQTNGIMPLDFKKSGRILGTPKADVRDFITGESQDILNSREKYDIFPNLGDSEESLGRKFMAFAYEKYDNTPIIVDTFDPPGFPPPVPIDADFDPNFLKSTAQFHQDYPDNAQIRADIIKILEGIAPPIEADSLEPNNAIGSATFLGSEPEIAIHELTIHENADVDYFRITANQTGKLVVTVPFTGANGDLLLQVRDRNNQVIASTQVTPAGAFQQAALTVPVVSQQRYFVRVSGIPASGDAEVQLCYDLEIENFPAPVPEAPVLHPNDDNGLSNSDNKTDVTNPRILIQGDLLNFVDDNRNGVVDPAEITILSAAEAVAANKAGAAVEVFRNGVSVGFADVVPGTGNALFQFTLTNAVLAGGTPINGGFFNLITSAVRIFDGQQNPPGTPAPATDRTQLSPPLRLFWVDTQGPRVDGVFIGGNPNFDIFDPKPTLGPTPLVNGLDISFVDQPTGITNYTVAPTAFSFEDIGATGTRLIFGNVDDDSQAVSLGFAFPFYQQVFGQVFVSTNGLLTFGAANAALNNVSLTVAGNPPAQPSIAPLWDDWDVDRNFNSDGVYVATVGALGNRRFIVQWRNLEHFDADGGGTVDFQAVLFENGAIEFRYRDVVTGDATEDNGISATVGVRNAEPSAVADGQVTQFSFDMPLIANNSALRFDPTLIPLVGSGVDPATALNPGNYRLVGDHVGFIPIANVVFANLPKALVTLTFDRPLPDDRYTLTVFDSVTDIAGNALDGESQAATPGGGQLPSGNGVAGGDFVARFTVDSRPEIAAWSAGTIGIDINGNFIFDPQNTDAVNRDIVHTFGFQAGPPRQSFASDYIFAGNFVRELNGTPDGFDKLAAYGRGTTGTFRFLVDFDNNGTPDEFPALVAPLVDRNVRGLPVAGNFQIIPANGDEVGVFDGLNWHFDTNHNFFIDDGDAPPLPSELRGYPIVGDFDGDGRDDLATYNDQLNRFEFDLFAAGGLTGARDVVIEFGFPGVRERPVAADMDRDGIDDIGLWVPDRTAMTPLGTAEWFFLISNDFVPGDGLNDRVVGTVNTLQHSFQPTPFAADLYAQFGHQFAVPLVGNFDPPIVAAAARTLNNPGPASTSPLASTTTTVVPPVTAGVATITHHTGSTTNAAEKPGPDQATVVWAAVQESSLTNQTANVATAASQSVAEPDSLSSDHAAASASPASGQTQPAAIEVQSAPTAKAAVVDAPSPRATPAALQSARRALNRAVQTRMVIRQPATAPVEAPVSKQDSPTVQPVAQTPAAKPDSPPATTTALPVPEQSSQVVSQVEPTRSIQPEVVVATPSASAVEPVRSVDIAVETAPPVITEIVVAVATVALRERTEKNDPVGQSVVATADLAIRDALFASGDWQVAPATANAAFKPAVGSTAEGAAPRSSAAKEALYGQTAATVASRARERLRAWKKGLDAAPLSVLPAASKSELATAYDDVRSAGTR